MQDTKGNLMPIVLCFGEDSVFALTLGVDSNPMLRQTAKHIFALADVDGLIINADFVDARVFIFICPAVSFQPFVHILFVGCSFIILHWDPRFLNL